MSERIKFPFSFSTPNGEEERAKFYPETSNVKEMVAIGDQGTAVMPKAYQVKIVRSSKEHFFSLILTYFNNRLLLRTFTTLRSDPPIFGLSLIPRVELP